MRNLPGEFLCQQWGHQLLNSVLSNSTPGLSFEEINLSGGLKSDLLQILILLHGLQYKTQQKLAVGGLEVFQ